MRTAKIAGKFNLDRVPLSRDIGTGLAYPTGVDQNQQHPLPSGAIVAVHIGLPGGEGNAAVGENSPGIAIKSCQCRV